MVELSAALCGVNPGIAAASCCDGILMAGVSRRNRLMTLLTFRRASRKVSVSLEVVVLSSCSSLLSVGHGVDGLKVDLSGGVD